MKQCFVISPIGEEGSEIRKHADDVFEYIIKPAMKECEIKAFRSDHLDKPGRISEQMFRSIYEADLCIAVLTSYNPNVFYELAVAQSAQRLVIILIERGQQLPFDISDLRCVYYDLEIRSYNERTHIKRIINYVREFEAVEWKVTDFFSAFRPLPASEVKELDFFETSSEFGGKSAWFKLLQDTKNVFDIMGVTLMGWRKTKDFRKMVIQKAADGCKVRILLMHLENPILPDVTDDMEIQRTNINQNFAFFKSIAQENGNIEVRQIHRGIPHFFLTRSDQYAVIIQYLSSQKWGSGPFWRCSWESKLYGVVTQEFETLWELNSQEPASEKDSGDSSLPPVAQNDTTLAQTPA